MKSIDDRPPASLVGYSQPFSPTGRSSLVAAPPWHFSGEVLYIEYVADPGAVRAFLPPELSKGNIDGRAAAIFGDWQSCTDSGSELLDPVRAQHRELAVVVACEWQGQPAARCPMCWVDADFSLVRGLIQGYPKKMGNIAITRSFGIGRADATIAPGSQFAASLAAGQRRLAECRVTLTEPSAPPSLMMDPLIHTRHFPAWDPDTDNLVQLVMSESVNQSFKDVWSGEAELTIFDSPIEDLALLAPVDVLGGYRFSFAETLTRGVVLGG